MATRAAWEAAHQPRAASAREVGSVAEARAATVRCRVMARRVCFVAVLSALALLFIPRVAHAAPVVHIEWPVVAGCPSAAFVQERARAELARAREADDVRAVAENHAGRAAPGQPWRLHLRTRTIRGAGERDARVADL